MGLELPEIHTNCSYPKGILFLAAERFLGNDDHFSLGNVAQCLAQSAVQLHG